MNNLSFVELNREEMLELNGGFLIFGVPIALATVAKVGAWGVGAGIAIGIAYFSVN